MTADIFHLQRIEQSSGANASHFHGMLQTFASSTAQVPISVGDSLAASITVEGLIFAAFSLSYGLTQAVEGGRHPFFAQGWFGWCVVGIIGVVAAAAFGSWWGAFASPWPSNWSGKVTAVGLLVGIISQPIIAGVLAAQSKGG